MKTFRISFLLVVLLIPGLHDRVHCRAAPPPTNAAVRVGAKAPDFALRSLDGEVVRLSDRLGKRPILVVFWSYFCFPCRTELPAVEALRRDIGPDQFQIIGVSLDGPRHDDRVRGYLKDEGITFPNAYDRETEEFFEVAQRYGVVGTPTTFLVDVQGRVRFIHLGRLDPAVIKGLIDGARDQSFCAEITKPPAPSDPQAGLGH